MGAGHEKGAIVRVIRTAGSTTGIYSVTAGRIQVNVPKKSAAILVRR